MKHRITGDHDDIMEQALKIVSEQGQHIPSVIRYTDDETIETRLCLGADGNLMRLLPRRKRYGVSLWRDRKTIHSIVLTLPNKDTATPAQKYVQDLRRIRRYFVKNSDRRLWSDYRAELESMTEEKLAELEKANCLSHFEAWELAGKLGLPRIECFKTTTLKSCKAPQYIVEAVERAIGQEAFSFYWRGSYDYSVSGKLCDDGVYRAWLSAEYKGLGNGHYYLLISAHHAIFCEDD